MCQRRHAVGAHLTRPRLAWHGVADVGSSRRRIAAGEELLNCYDAGELDEATFMTRFGFVPGRPMADWLESIGGKGKLPFGFRVDDRPIM